MDFDNMTDDYIRESYPSLSYDDKTQLIRRKGGLSQGVLTLMFDDPEFDNSMLWPHFPVDGFFIVKHAKTPSDWSWVCRLYKMTPAFMTEHRDWLRLDFIDYRKYHAEELISTDGILFPLPSLRKAFNADDLVKLFKASKVTDKNKGGVITVSNSSWGSFYTNNARALWTAMKMCKPTDPFSVRKKFMVADNNIHAYRGPRLTYSNLLEIMAESPNYLSRWGLLALLNRSQLHVTNEEWDALLAMIEFSR